MSRMPFTGDAFRCKAPVTRIPRRGANPTLSSSTDGIAMLDRLVARMPQRGYQARRTAVQKTRTWILRVAQTGGADAPMSKTFLEPGSRDERIDIEIIAGSAFVP